MLATLAAALSVSQFSSNGPALGGLDPVALCKGEDVVGKVEFETKSLGYTYRFASKESLNTFNSDPERWGIQLGGACGNMGPLSGRGSMSNYLVHEGRIWIFASGSCREAFKKNPAAFLDRPDKPVVATAIERETAMGWIDRAIAAHGGWTAFASIKHFAMRDDVFAGKPKALSYSNHSGIAANGGYYWGQSWPGGGVHYSAVNGKSWYRDSKGVYDVGSQERGFIEREAIKHPIALLRRSRSRGFVAKPLGEQTLADGRKVQSIATSFGGATMTLHIDLKTDWIVGSQTWGRPQGGANRTLNRTYAHFKRVGGVLFPTRIETSWPDQVNVFPAKEIAEVRVNAAEDAGLFERRSD